MLDKQDQKILAERQAAFLARLDPKQGDVVRFANGTIRRISHVWKENDKAFSIQTADARFGSSFYIGDGYMEFSGGLYSGVDANTFTRTNETMECGAWFFHHHDVRPHNGIDVEVLCPVWECSLPANQ